MSMQPPPGQDPIDPQGAFSTPPPPPPLPPFPPTPPQSPFPPSMSGGGVTPPFPQMPPMMMMPPQAPKQGGGFIRGIFVTLALSIFSISLLANLYMFLALGVSEGGDAIQKTVIKDGDNDQQVVVLPVSGAIMEGDQKAFKKMMDMIKDDKNVKALVIEMDTPGGTVTASDGIRREIELYRKDKPGVPVVVSMGAVAASGGYYIATAGQMIFAEPTTLTGSIGVRMDMYNVADLAKKWGVSETTITAPLDGMKNAGSSFKPMTQEEQAYFQGIVDDAFGRFKNLVKTGRGSKIKSENLDQACSARIFTANQALSYGLIDQIGYFDEACVYAAKTAGLSKEKVVRFSRRETLLDLLGANSKTGGAGVNIHIDSELIHDLEQPKLMYLWRP